MGFMSKVVGQHLRNSIRDFVEYDTRNNMLFWKKYIRICVLVDLRRPLMKNKKVKIPGGEWSVIQIKYERRWKFCFFMWRLGTCGEVLQGEVLVNK